MREIDLVTIVNSPKECWINIYKYDYIRGVYYSRENAIEWGLQLRGEIAYRLHVKLKDKPGIYKTKYFPWNNFNRLKDKGLV